MNRIEVPPSKLPLGHRRLQE